MLVQAVSLPELPSNAQYIFHKNECFDWGTFGWAMQRRSLDLASYHFYIFMNSSVRGPFLPSYLQVCLAHNVHLMAVQTHSGGGFVLPSHGMCQRCHRAGHGQSEQSVCKLMQSCTQDSTAQQPQPLALCP